MSDVQREDVTATERVQRIRQIVEGLPEGYDLYAAVGALVSIAAVLGDDPPDERWN